MAEHSRSRSKSPGAHPPVTSSFSHLWPPADPTGEKQAIDTKEKERLVNDIPEEAVSVNETQLPNKSPEGIMNGYGVVNLAGRKTTGQANDLEEHFAALSILEENLKKMDQTTVKMSSILAGVVETRLGKIEENIKPIYHTTKTLTQMSQSKIISWKQ